jgi:hypothetical protein
MTRPLGRRQLRALEILKRGALDGARLGQLLHSERGLHPPGDEWACQWCARDGINVLVSLVRRDLVRVLAIKVELRAERRDAEESSAHLVDNAGAASEGENTAGIDVDAELERLRARVRRWETGDE